MVSFQYNLYIFKIHLCTVLYPKPCYNETCYKGVVVYNSMDTIPWEKLFAYILKGVGVGKIFSSKFFKRSPFEKQNIQIRKHI